VSDEKLLKAIQADLKRSPFRGEGHRKGSLKNSFPISEMLYLGLSV
jgi:hypothetical protein